MKRMTSIERHRALMSKVGAAFLLLSIVGVPLFIILLR